MAVAQVTEKRWHDRLYHITLRDSVKDKASEDNRDRIYFLAQFWRLLLVSPE